MFGILKKSLIVLICVMSGQLYAAELKGYFLTHVGESGRQSIVEFFEDQGKFYAYGFANVDGSGPKADAQNPDPRLKNRMDKGAVFVYGLKKSGKSYKDGFIYNFDDGKDYYLKVHFKDDNTLEMRASIDSMGMMGQTLEWRKLTQAEEQKYLPEKPDFSVVKESLQTLREIKKGI